MRTRHWLVLVSLGFGVVGVVGAGCGGSSTQAGNDAGSDGTMMPDVTMMMMDTAPPPPMDAGHDSMMIVDAPPEACAVDADLTMLNPPDAAIPGADASIGTCLACAQMNCMSEITTCNGDCACKDAIVNFFGCAGSGMPIMGCAGGVLGNAGAQALGLCLLSSCVDPCGINTFFPEGGTDGMTTDGMTGDGSATDGSGE